MNSIHETIHQVLSEEGIDRQHHLYTRKGHKKIQLKPIAKFSP